MSSKTWAFSYLYDSMQTDSLPSQAVGTHVWSPIKVQIKQPVAYIKEKPDPDMGSP